MDNKVTALCASIVANCTDVFIVSESWITGKNGALVDANFTSSFTGYIAHLVPIEGKGCGLAIVVRYNMKVTKKVSESYESMESIDYNMGSGESM